MISRASSPLSETGENVLPGSNPGGGKHQHEVGAPLEPVSLSGSQFRIYARTATGWALATAPLGDEDLALDELSVLKRRDRRTSYRIIRIAATDGECADCRKPVNDGPFRFCWRCRQVDLSLLRNGARLAGATR